MEVSFEVLDAIEDLVWKHDISMIDAIVLYCEDNNVDIEALGKAIKSNQNLKGSIQLEAESLNYLPKTSHLPV